MSPIAHLQHHRVRIVTERYIQDEDISFRILRRQGMMKIILELEIREYREADVNNQRKLF
jgi:hypothetical protein